MQNIVVIFPFGKVPYDKLEGMGRKVMLEPTSPAGEGKDNSRRQAFYAGRAALAFGFKYLELKAFVKPASGYGYLEIFGEDKAPANGLFCNVTHTGDMVLAAIASTPVGVDVERLDRSVGNVLRRIASENELVSLASGNPHLAQKGIPQDLALWCSKEAYTKSLGLGLGASLERVDIGIEEEPPFPVHSTLIGPQHLEEPRIDVSTYQDYLIAISTELQTTQDGFQRLLFEVGF